MGVTDRYEALQNPMGLRKQRLLDSLRVQQLFRDVEDEEAWIREKEIIDASKNPGRDLIDVQNLLNNHVAIIAEMINHEPQVRAVCQAGFHIAKDGHFAADEVRQRSQALDDNWALLKQKSLQRKVNLDDSFRIQTQLFNDRQAQINMANSQLAWVVEYEQNMKTLDGKRDRSRSPLKRSDGHQRQSTPPPSVNVFHQRNPSDETATKKKAKPSRAQRLMKSISKKKNAEQPDLERQEPEQPVLQIPGELKPNNRKRKEFAKQLELLKQNGL